MKGEKRFTYKRVGTMTYVVSTLDGVEWATAWRTRTGWNVKVGSVLVVEDYQGSRETATGAAHTHYVRTLNTNET